VAVTFQHSAENKQYPWTN